MQRKINTSDHTPVSFNEFQIQEEIGRGSFGSVRKVIHLPTNKLMVRKEIRYGHMNSKERQQLISECSILSQLKHENIVEFYKWDSDGKDTLYIYMEYCSKGDLSQMIKNYKQQRKHISEKIVWRIMIQILLALYKCHYASEFPKLDTIYDKISSPKQNPRESDGKKKYVIHRDLKPGNVFLAGDDYEKCWVKLGDFGLAKSLQSSIEFATTYVGTPYYMSPEVLMDQPYSPLSDIWSLGCVVYEMCSLKVPFQAKTYRDLQAKIKQGSFERIPDYYSNELQTVIKSCISIDINERPNTYQLLQSIQARIVRKTLQLERFENHLLDYEKELTKIGEILEKQALNNDKEIAELKLQYRRDLEVMVEQRVREIIGNKKNNIPTDMNYNRYHPSPWKR